MQSAIIPLIGAILLGPVFIEPSESERHVAGAINAMVKMLGDQAAALPHMPLHVLDFAARPDPSSPPAALVEPPADVAIDVVCRALSEAADANGLPVGFFARLIWTESRFRQRAVSHAGAQGVAQFMPATAAEFGLADPFDPLQALPASARFLRKLRDQFGNLGLAAAAYNAGGGRVQEWLARKKTLPTETQNYVRAVTGHDAETWTRDAKELGLEHKLPRAAPCEGEGGLSTQSKPIAIKVALSSNASEIVRKAEAAAEEARKARIEAERRALAALRKKGKRVQFAKGKSRPAVKAKAIAARKSLKIKVAAAER
ncbi:MAG: lytic transglycosylase domain-containing protein [Pseudomonadota bacterium]